MLPLLDDALRRYAGVMTRFAGEDFTDAPGAGAAGGLGFALMAMMRGETLGGAELVLDMAGFDDKIQEADLVITGEGRLDSQTLMGKGPAVVLNRAMHSGVPVVAVAGAIDTSAIALLREAGFIDVCGISDPALPAEIAMNPSVTIHNIQATVREKLPQWLA